MIITQCDGRAIIPSVSSVGQKMAFIKVVVIKSLLSIRDLESGIERPVYDQLSKDQQEAWAIFGPYTNLDWTPDSKNLVFWSEGKINKLNIASREAEVVPFEAEIQPKIYDAVSFKQNP